jgi:pyridoxine 5-phosphate synthase
VESAVKRLRDAGIVVSLFLDPDQRQIDAATALGVNAVELHTGAYAHATSKFGGEAELAALQLAARQVVDAGLVLHAGHGLTYRNVQPICAN